MSFVRKHSRYDEEVSKKGPIFREIPQKWVGAKANGLTKVKSDFGLSKP